MARFSGGSGIGGRGGGCGTEGSHEIGFGDASHERVDDEVGGFGELAREFLEGFDDEGEDGAVVDAGEVAVCIVGVGWG